MRTTPGRGANQRPSGSGRTNLAPHHLTTDHRQHPATTAQPPGASQYAPTVSQIPSSSPARTIIRPCDPYHQVITTGPPDWRPHPRRCCTGPAPNRISACVQAGSQTRTRLRSNCHCERRTLSLRAPYPCHCERRTPVIASAVPLSLRAPCPCHCERRAPVIASAVPLSLRAPCPCHCERRTPVITSALSLSLRAPYPLSLRAKRGNLVGGRAVVQAVGSPRRFTPPNGKPGTPEGRLHVDKRGPSLLELSGRWGLV